MYKRILLKLSGEAISAKDFPFSQEVIEDIASQIKQIHEMGVEIGVVIGGGNICRGRLFEEMGFDRVQSDYAGMLGTVINALILSAKLNQMGVKAKALSAVKAESVDMFEKEEANRLLEEGYVLIFGGGVGKPYHSTDTGSAQRAMDIHADVILMAKTGVDGVYDSDPDILDLNLKVIDSQAAELCREGKIEAFVFNMLEENNIVKAVRNETVGTRIKF